MNYAFCLRWGTVHKERLGGLLLRCRSQNSRQPFQVLTWVTFSHSLPGHRQKSPNLKSWADFCLCVYYTKSEPISKIAEWIAPPPLADARVSRKKMFLAFRICARPNFLLKGWEHFSLLFCPPSIRAGGGTNADSVLRKLFFGEESSACSAVFFWRNSGWLI